MTAIQAIFKPSKDGEIRLSIPPELRGIESLRVIVWMEPETDAPLKTGAGEWARNSVGIASSNLGESSDDARFAALAHKYGTR